jgi:hypothetical protein
MCVTRDAVNSINRFEIFMVNIKITVFLGEHRTQRQTNGSGKHNASIRHLSTTPPDAISQQTVVWNTNVSSVEKTIHPVGRNGNKFLCLIYNHAMKAHDPG